MLDALYNRSGQIIMWTFAVLMTLFAILIYLVRKTNRFWVIYWKFKSYIGDMGDNVEDGDQSPLKGVKGQALKKKWEKVQEE